MTLAVTLDWIFISSKFVALFSLLCFAVVSTKTLLFGQPADNVVEKVEHSLFVLVAVATVFHFTGRLASDAILAADMSVMGKRQLYYIFFSVHELLAIAAIVHFHNRKGCELAKVTRYICYLSAVSVVLQLLRYADRVVFDTNLLNVIYSQGLISLNLFTSMLMLAYPIARALRIELNSKWL
ncbi:hypothetical protein ACFOEE_14535 [Pseudoalteromonas fenneropenaei]|uniref:Uncharacterized protein n=1 Tax=Pseudoalteromonas fenneropenaei TaxID=1737459 RepID=A0ABV7CMI6_9GAMM